jgi:hypothetical protein
MILQGSGSAAFITAIEHDPSVILSLVRLIRISAVSHSVSSRHTYELALSM